MTLPEYGLVLIALGIFAWWYLSRSARLDRAERRAAILRHPSSADLWRELDRAVPVWSRSAVYDWAERGDL